MAHGYLLELPDAGPNRRIDYGSLLENRARLARGLRRRSRLAEKRPMSVRISATDWVEHGIRLDDAVAFTGMLKKHGCDIVDVSTGQTTPDARPSYGRSYQTPFADAIRHRVGIPTIAVGAISSYDDVNSIAPAGRADLCALARSASVRPGLDAARRRGAGVQRRRCSLARPVQEGSRRPQTGRRDLGVEPSPFERLPARTAHPVGGRRSRRPHDEPARSTEGADVRSVAREVLAPIAHEGTPGRVNRALSAHSAKRGSSSQSCRARPCVGARALPHPRGAGDESAEVDGLRGQDSELTRSSAPAALSLLSGGDARSSPVTPSRRSR